MTSARAFVVLKIIATRDGATSKKRSGVRIDCDPPMYVFNVEVSVEYI